MKRGSRTAERVLVVAGLLLMSLVVAPEASAMSCFATASKPFYDQTTDKVKVKGQISCSSTAARRPTASTFQSGSLNRG